MSLATSATWFAIAIACLVLGGGCGGKAPANDPVNAREVPRPAVAMDASCGEAVHDHLAAERLAEAAAQAQTCVELTPGSAEALDLQGETALLLGELDGATRAFEAALAAQPDFALAHQGLAAVRFHRGDAVGGMAALRAGLALTSSPDPTYARTRLFEDLAVALFADGERPAAFEAIEASVEALALRSSSAYAVSQVGRAKLLLHAGKWREAIRELDQTKVPGAESFAQDAAAAVKIMVLAGEGELEEAAAAHAELLAQLGAEHPRMAEPTLALALARGQLDAAAALLARFQDPYAAERAQLMLALALQRAGRKEEAAQRLTAVTRRFGRSVDSAQLRRAALRALQPQAQAPKK